MLFPLRHLDRGYIMRRFLSLSSSLLDHLPIEIERITHPHLCATKNATCIPQVLSTNFSKSHGSSILLSAPPHTLLQHTSRQFSQFLASTSGRIGPEGEHSLDEFPPDKIRSFSIIAHVDHGKSTLSDRLLEYTGMIRKGSHEGQFLDKLAVERERGITVKAQTASLVHFKDGQKYLLNLIDTPGHVDFSYEVSRSLQACQGAVLLTDAAQGVQAQTVANFYLAFELGLTIVPVLNKIDLPIARPEEIANQLQLAFDIDPATVIQASAKSGLGIQQVLDAIIDRVPPPTARPDRPLKLLLFDAFHDDFRGVICLVSVVDGQLHKGDRVTSVATGATYEALEVGVLAPNPISTQYLGPGQVGYVITGMKSSRHANIGDTWHRFKEPVEALPGFRAPRPMVFAGLYPPTQDGFEGLREALDRLLLNDASVTTQRETSQALGSGFRCGFLGVLHLEVFQQRLKDEYGADAIITTPTVSYSVEMGNGEVREITNACQFPVGEKIHRVLEPVVLASIITPSSTLGKVMELCQRRRGIIQEQTALGGDRALVKYQLPLAELASDFFSELKGLTQGYATLDYEPAGERPADLVRMDILINEKPVDALAMIVYRPNAAVEGRRLCQRLQELLDRQQFEIVLQAAVGSSIVARESIKPYRKDVTAKCYGGDITRKRKLLERQKEGKRQLKMIGRVEVPFEAFSALLKRGG